MAVFAYFRGIERLSQIRSIRRLLQVEVPVPSRVELNQSSHPTRVDAQREVDNDRVLRTLKVG